jgi:hypothetical protein
MILHSLHLLLVVLRHQAVHLQALSHHLVVNLHHQAQHKLLLVILLVHQQINLLHKAAVVNPEQAKLKQQVIAPANQVLV